MEASDRKIYRVASGTTIVIAICAAVLSYSALRELAIASGINGALAYLFPLTLDGLILIGALMVLFAATRGRRSWGGVFLTGLGVVSSVAGNVAVSPNTLTARLVHAAAPVVLFLAVEAVTSLMRKMRNETHSDREREVEMAHPEPVASKASAFFEGTPASTEKTEPSPAVVSPATTTVPHVRLEPQISAPAEETPRNTPAPSSISLQDAESVTSPPALVVPEPPAPQVITTPSEPVVTPEAPVLTETAEVVQQKAQVETSVQQQEDSLVSEVKLRPDMTARQRIVAYIEAGYRDVGFIAGKVEGDRKYIRKLTREELERRELTPVL